MSRSFNGTTNRLDWANIDNLAGSAFTLSAWVWLDALNGASNNYIFCINDSGDTQYGIVVNIIAGRNLDVIRHGTTDYIWYENATVMNTGAWHHILITSDGGVVAGSVVIYVDGVISAGQGFSNGSGAETAHTGKWSLGGRIYSDNRNHNGKIAQVGVWNRVLTAGEIANLAARYAPDLAAASGLLFNFRGNTSDLHETVANAEGTADGTTEVTGVGNGPSIIYA